MSEFNLIQVRRFWVYECFSDNRESNVPSTYKAMFRRTVRFNVKKESLHRTIKNEIRLHLGPRKQKNQNGELKQFVQKIDLKDKIDSSESFYGDHTNASQLYYKVNENEEIRYVDFASLYL